MAQGWLRVGSAVFAADGSVLVYGGGWSRVGLGPVSRGFKTGFGHGCVLSHDAGPGPTLNGLSKGKQKP